MHVAAISAPEALETLKAGNQRFVESMTSSASAPLGARLRRPLVDQGERPSAIILGCADSRAPIDAIFDAQPGDLFILRNAGNTLCKAEGSVLSSMEYAVAHLESKLILVLGHTNCGAIAGATQVMLERKRAQNRGAEEQRVVNVLLGALAPVVEMTAAQLPPDTRAADIASKAVKKNVLNSMSNILECSSLVRDRVRAGDVEVHGGVYDLKTGRVEFLGQHPRRTTHSSWQ